MSADVLAHVGRAGDQALGAVGHPALDAVDVATAGACRPSPGGGRTRWRGSSRRAGTRKRLARWSPARRPASRGRGRGRSRSGRRARRPRRACPRSCARSRRRTRPARAGARARARGGRDAAAPPPRRARLAAARQHVDVDVLRRRGSRRACARGARGRPRSSGGYSQDRIRTRAQGERERGQVEIGGEVARRTPRHGGGVCQSAERGVQRRRGGLDALARVVAGERAGDHEGPVARLERQQLARGALQRGARLGLAGGGRDGAQLAAARGERDVGRPRPNPRSTGPWRLPQVDGASSTLAAARRALERLVDGDQRRGPARGRLARAPPPATPAPSYHQWPSSSVSSAQHEQSPPPADRAAQPRASRRSRRACVARQRERRVAVVGRAGVVPRPVGRARCGGGSRGRRRAPGSRRVAPHELDRLASRSAPARAGGGRAAACRWSRAPRPKTLGQVDAERAHAGVGERRARARARRRTRAARSRRRQRRRSGARCDSRSRSPAAGARPASVASSGSSACVAAERPQLDAAARERAEQVAAARSKLVRGALVVARGALELGGQLAARRAREAVGVRRVRSARGARAGTQEALARRAGSASSWSHSTGVSDSVHGAPPSSTSSSGR